MFFRRILDLPFVYNFFKLAIGAKRGQAVYKREYIGDVTNLSVLDIGCGPADILSLLEPCSYVGVDSSERYISDALSKYSRRDRTTFLLGDFISYVESTDLTFDMILSHGALHHISDADLHRVLAASSRVLRPGGRFVSLDCANTTNMRRVAKFLNDADRGAYIRSETEWLDIMSRYFTVVNWDVRTDLRRIPSSLIVFNNSL